MKFMKNFIKTLSFFIAFYAVCLNTVYKEDISQDSSLEPVNSTVDYLKPSEENHDIYSLKAEKLKDIKSPRNIKTLNLNDDFIIDSLVTAPGLIEHKFSQNLEKNGLVETALMLNYSSDKNNSNFNNTLKINKYRNKTLTLKLSQLIPFQQIEEEHFITLRKIFLQCFLEEDYTELHNKINTLLKHHTDNYSKTNNSSQNYCFTYGNYGVNLSFQNNIKERDSLLFSIYVFLDQQ
ncbi:hypothetical protein [Clostridium polynesiense]|uniref:hypothetical protein n=1 Tax=Clostridium polynesiense TaxID=1325933 RepID=UPI0005907052|nr:hypothetical protein [Clostridium polynesiense]